MLWNIPWSTGCGTSWEVAERVAMFLVIGAIFNSECLFGSLKDLDTVHLSAICVDSGSGELLGTH